jgi:hypothetical protein
VIVVSMIPSDSACSGVIEAACRAISSGVRPSNCASPSAAGCSSSLLHADVPATSSNQMRSRAATAADAADLCLILVKTAVDIGVELTYLFHDDARPLPVRQGTRRKGDN